MIRSSRSKWVSGIGAAVLSGSLVVAGYGIGVTPAGATDLVNPFPIIIAKLNQILAKLSTSGGGAGNHTLRWDSNITNASGLRFTTAFPGAVLDNNTGLVWEQAPDGTSRNWETAKEYCLNKEVIVGMKGWRLPSVVELASVQDRLLAAPLVPASAFTISTSVTIPGVQSSAYWSATTAAFNPVAYAWIVNFGDGSLPFALGSVGVDSKSNNSTSRAWCVRGGMNADTY